MKEVLYTLSGMLFVLCRASSHLVLSNWVFLIWLAALTISWYKKSEDQQQLILNMKESILYMNN